MDDDEKYHSLTASQWERVRQARELMTSIQKEIGKDYYTMEWGLVNNIADLLKGAID